MPSSFEAFNEETRELALLDRPRSASPARADERRTARQAATSAVPAAARRGRRWSQRPAASRVVAVLLGALAVLAAVATLL